MWVMRSWLKEEIKYKLADILNFLEPQAILLRHASLMWSCNDHGKQAIELMQASYVICGYIDDHSSIIKAERAKRVRLRYRGGIWGDGSDPVGTSASPPTGIKHSGPNSQGFIKLWEISSSNVRFFKKLSCTKVQKFF